MAIPTNIRILLSGDVVEWAKIEFKETWDPEASLKTVLYGKCPIQWNLLMMKLKIYSVLQITPLLMTM